MKLSMGEHFSRLRQLLRDGKIGPSSKGRHYDRVQIQNPRSGEWVLIDRTEGCVVAHSPDPWPGVQVVRQPDA